MSRKNARRSSVRQSRPNSAVKRPVNTQLVELVLDSGRGPAGTPTDLAKTLDRQWFRSHP
jgi:hypothetical protein